jgi:hypothetical protein
MMSLSCVEELLRTVSDRFTEFLVKADRFERAFQFEDKVGRYIFTLALLNYLLNRCLAFRVERELEVVYFNCDGRYLYIQTDSWKSSWSDPDVGTKIERNIFANALFNYYAQSTSNLPKSSAMTDEEREFLSHLSKVNTIIITPPYSRPTELLYITNLVYRAAPIEVSVNGDILRDPSLLIIPDATKPEVDEVAFLADITLKEIPYQVYFYPSSGKIEETIYSEYKEYAWVGRQGACLVKDKLLDEFSRLMNLLNGAFSSALTYLLY